MPYLVDIRTGNAKDTGKAYMMLSLLSDDLKTKREVFANNALFKKGVSDDLISTPDNMVRVELEDDVFSGLSDIVEA